MVTMVVAMTAINNLLCCTFLTIRGDNCLSFVNGPGDTFFYFLASRLLRLWRCLLGNLCAYVFTSDIGHVCVRFEVHLDLEVTLPIFFSLDFSNGTSEVAAATCWSSCCSLSNSHDYWHDLRGSSIAGRRRRSRNSDTRGDSGGFGRGHGGSARFRWGFCWG